MIVLRSTMDAAVEKEREHYRNLSGLIGQALWHSEALQKQLANWITEKGEQLTPEQFAVLFYSHDDRWQAKFFNVMQKEVQAYHDALPAGQVWGKCHGVPAGEGQWWHMVQHLDDSGFETLEAMYEHAKSKRSNPDPFFASADTRPEGGDSTKIEAPFTSGAVPHEDEADAQTAHPIQPRERK